MATNEASSTPEGVTETLKSEYQLYLAARERNDDAAVEAFMSPSCWQISRQNPAWNLSNRSEIMRILASMRKADDVTDEREKGTVEMRALTLEERDTLPDTEKEKALREGWEGLRVDLVDPDRVVKVNYYWRKEEGRWVQCLHDLLWVGPRDGSAQDDVVASVFAQK